jgi:hypothetical protein
MGALGLLDLEAMEESPPSTVSQQAAEVAVVIVTFKDVLVSLPRPWAALVAEAAEVQLTVAE